MFETLYKKTPDNWDQYLSQVLASYHVIPHLTTGETHFFLVYRRDPNLPLHQLWKPMQHFLGDPDSGCLNLEMHHSALAIARRLLMKTDSEVYRKLQTDLHQISELETQYISKPSNLENGIGNGKPYTGLSV